MSSFVSQSVQLGGSLLILVPFVLVQLGRVRTRDLNYVLANAVGSGVLAVDALLGAQWGFLLLEGVWALVSIGSLTRLVLTTSGQRRRRSRNASTTRLETPATTPATVTDRRTSGAR